MKIENMNRYAPLAVGLMEIENLFRYTALAVGLKPSANQGKARLRGLYRIIYSKTISPHEAHEEGSTYLRTAIYSQSSSRPQRRTVESACLGARASTPACGDGGLMEIENLFRYPALAVELKPSAMQGEARLRGLASRPRQRPSSW